jgi:spore coat protein A
MHLHGGHVAEASDGYPENALLPGSMAVYDYPNWQESAQIWYHDHALGITRLNVYMGLAGLYTVRDSIEDALDLPAGDDEVPLVIQDRSFGPDGSLVYPAEWQEHFFGDTILVNGKVWPFHEVARGKVRFRLLNGSNSRVYELYLSDGATMTVIGGDGGFLDAPIDVDEVTLAPGERADVVIDFEGYAAGTEVLLLNRAPAPYPGVPGVGVVPNVVKLVVADRVGHTAPLPGTLRTLDRLDEADAVLTRDFELRRGPDDCGGRAWYINDLRWDDLTEMPALGTTEVWRFVNRSGHIHPMHMHLVFFQVLDRQPFEIVGDTINPLGSPLPPEPHETGPKDTVLVGPNEIVRVIARFEDFVGRFAYHCHVLEHEDHEMMRQFLTTTTCGDGARGLPDEECDDGNTLDGDGCSATCALESGVDSGPMPDGGSPDGSSPDGSSPDGGDGGAEPGPNDGGCGCRVPRRGGSGLAPWWAFSAVALFLSLLRRTSRRRRRKLSIAGRSVQ